jgi:hypothetical protein
VIDLRLRNSFQFISGNLELARYGVYAFWLHSTLKPGKKDHVPAASGKSSKLSMLAVVARNIRYGPVSIRSMVVGY